MLLRTGKFEIVDVDDQEKLVYWMPKGTVPIGNSLKAHTSKVCFAMCFPVASRIGVTVQCQVKWTYWTYHACLYP